MRRYITIGLHLLAAAALWRWPPSRAIIGECLIQAGSDVLDSLPDAEPSDEFSEWLAAEMMGMSVRRDGGPL